MILLILKKVFNAGWESDSHPITPKSLHCGMFSPLDLNLNSDEKVQVHAIDYEFHVLVII